MKADKRTERGGASEKANAKALNCSAYLVCARGDFNSFRLLQRFSSSAPFAASETSTGHTAHTALIKARNSSPERRRRRSAYFTAIVHNYEPFCGWLFNAYRCRFIVDHSVDYVSFHILHSHYSQRTVERGGCARARIRADAINDGSRSRHCSRSDSVSVNLGRRLIKSFQRNPIVESN